MATKSNYFNLWAVANNLWVTVPKHWEQIKKEKMAQIGHINHQRRWLLARFLATQACKHDWWLHHHHFFSKKSSENFVERNGKAQEFQPPSETVAFSISVNLMLCGKQMSLKFYLKGKEKYCNLSKIFIYSSIVS